MGRGKRRRQKAQPYLSKVEAPELTCPVLIDYEYLNSSGLSAGVSRIWQTLAERYLENPGEVGIILTGDWKRSLQQHASADSAKANQYAAGIALRDGEKHTILVSAAREYAGGKPLTSKRRQIVVAHEAL